MAALGRKQTFEDSGCRRGGDHDASATLHRRSRRRRDDARRLLGLTPVTGEEYQGAARGVRSGSSSVTSMYPTWTVAGQDVSTQSIVLFVVVFVSLVFGPSWIARLEGLEAWRIRRAQLVLAVAPLVVGRLHFVVNNPYFYSRAPWRAFVPWGGGIHMSGALIGILVGAPLVARYYRIPIAKFCDGLVPIVCLAAAAMRLGCMLAGCCFGTPCDHGWCVVYPRGSFPYLMQQQAGMVAADAAHSLAVHPAPLYFLASGVFAAVVALVVNRRKHYDGQVVWVGLVALFGTTTAVEPFRALENHRAFWGGIPQLAWVEAALAVVGIVGLAIGALRHRRPVTTDAIGPAPLVQAAGSTRDR